MINRAIFLAFVALSGCGRAAPPPNLGQPPGLGTAARDLSASFRLPPLADQAGGELARRIDELQLGKRARLLKLHARSASDAWTAADAIVKAARARLDAAPPGNLRLFHGERASELNALLANPAVLAVKVTSARLQVDEPVRVRRAKLWLDLGAAELRGARGGPRFLVRMENAPGATLSGGAFLGGQWGVLVDGGRDVTLRWGHYEGLERGGVVLTNSPGAVLAHAVLTRLGAAPVLVHGDTDGALIMDDEIVGNLGASNWNAGVVLSDRNGPVADDPASILNLDEYGAREQPIDTRLRAPRHTVLLSNRIALNASSGIYCDGAIESVIFNNTVEGNSKEGICLDNGSAANVLAMNLVRGNGKRWGKTDEQLELDFVDAMGRLPDGSSPAKTPGISLDNALYNIVYANEVERNYGGGIKMVRTAYLNIVGLNTIIDNNEGASERFHFFGLELGAAPADVPVADLDFTPCRGNILFGNTIRGSHYAGIFFGEGSTNNDAFDNTVFGAVRWALEQARPQPNSSLNNLTNLPSRNIEAGIDPNLLKVTKGQFD